MPGIVDQILSIKAFDLPIGSALLMAGAFGLSDGLSGLLTDLTKQYLPVGIPGEELLINGGIALAINNITAVKDFLGPELTELISIATLVTGLNGVVNVTDTISGIFQSVSNMVSGGGSTEEVPMVVPEESTVASEESTVAPEESATSSGEMSGYNLGGYDMGNPETSQVDDVDLALLSARGYRTA